jgi:hypothetical protein
VYIRERLVQFKDWLPKACISCKEWLCQAYRPPITDIKTKQSFFNSVDDELDLLPCTATPKYKTFYDDLKNLRKMGPDHLLAVRVFHKKRDLNPSSATASSRHLSKLVTACSRHLSKITHVSAESGEDEKSDIWLIVTNYNKDGEMNKWWDTKDNDRLKRRSLMKRWLQMQIKLRIAFGQGLVKQKYVLKRAGDGMEQVVVDKQMIGNQITGDKIARLLISRC